LILSLILKRKMSEFSDQQILEYEQAIKDEEARKAPLVSMKTRLSVLKEECKNYAHKIDVKMKDMRHRSNLYL
jgi:hypothetical protein